MDTAITRAEHEESIKRIDAENDRQNKRLEILEESYRQLSTLTSAVDRLATSMEAMLKEQEKQGERLSVLERQPAERWQSIIRTAITSIVSVAAGALATGLIILMAQHLI